jgi:hypothetical protein
MIFFEYRCFFRRSQPSGITTKEKVALIHENYCSIEKKLSKGCNTMKNFLLSVLCALVSIVVVGWSSKNSSQSFVVVCDIAKNKVIKTIARLPEARLYDALPIFKIWPLEDSVLIIYRDMHIEKIAKSRLLEEESTEQVENQLVLLTKPGESAARQDEEGSED